MEIPRKITYTTYDTDMGEEIIREIALTKDVEITINHEFVVGRAREKIVIYIEQHSRTGAELDVMRKMFQ